MEFNGNMGFDIIPNPYPQLLIFRLMKSGKREIFSSTHQGF
ncbi:MAG: hypothetical protein RL387_49 [Bacteroidota bacterium]|jgi:hypothetical protein